MAPFRLAFPRMHRELLPPGFPPEVPTLWPGLPHAPATGVWTPDFAWSPEQAAACLADLENSAVLGAQGAPMAAMAVEGLRGAADLSPAERRALLQFSHQDIPVHTGDDEKTRAQTVLLLAWLREKQVLELRALTRKTRQQQAQLARLLDQEARQDPEDADELPLPEWRPLLTALQVFLPPDCTLIISDANLAVEMEKDLFAEKVSYIECGEQAFDPSAGSKG